MAAQTVPTILRRKQVEGRTGLARSTIYQNVRAGLFPAPISLGSKSVGWIEAEVNEWLQSRIDDSRKVSDGAEKIDKPHVTQIPRPVKFPLEAAPWDSDDLLQCQKKQENAE
jgi:prophage regulatory protein